MNTKKLLYPIIFVFVLSCSGENQQDDDSMHPIQEKLPYSNVNPDLPEVRDGGEYIDSMPESVQVLYRFLNYESQAASQQELDLLTTGNIDVSAINDSTLLVLEIGSNRLVQYDLKGDQYEVIADRGRGPGDLYFERELSVYNDKAFIAMQAYRLSVFSCDYGGCEYEKTLQTEYNNYSVAPLDDHLYFLGIPPFGGEQYADSAAKEQNLIHKINYEGDHKQSYLPAYNFWAPMVRERMNSGGQVRVFPEYDITIVTFDFFPYLYSHNNEGKLTAIYEIPGFIQGFYEFEERSDGRWRGRLVYDSNSRISATAKLDDKWLLIKIREQRDVEFLGMDEGFEGDEWYSYYLFNIEKEKLFKIGDDTKTPVNESRVIHVVDNGIVINESGLLYWQGVNSN